MRENLRSHRDLEVFQKAMALALEVHELSRAFPREELYSLTDQIRRSSRSICANLAEAWRKRRYEKAFVSKLSDAEGEAAEVQVWIEFAVKFSYLERERGLQLYRDYDSVLGMLVTMLTRPQDWLLPSSGSATKEERADYGDPF